MARPLRAEAPSQRVEIRLSPEERERLRKAADANRQTVSAFIRDAVEDAASDCLDTHR